MSNQEKSITTENNSEQIHPKPYAQRPGEPDRWYERFEHFCRLGRSRTLELGYQEVLGDGDVGGSRKRVSGAWKQKAGRR